MTRQSVEFKSARSVGWPGREEPVQSVRDRPSDTIDLVLKCAAGLEDVVARAAVADCRGLRLKDVESGFLRGSVARQALGCALGLPYAAWIGIGLPSVAKRRATIASAAVRAVDPAELQWAISPKRRLTFRLRCLDDNQLIAVDAKAVSAAVRAIERRNPLLRYNPRDAQVEIWIFRRRGARDFEGLARRVSRRRSTRGALDEDVAAALVRVFDPAPDDVVIDPFAGYGTIPAARSRYPAEWIGACDIAPPRSPGFPVERADFFSDQLTRYLDGRKPNAVVTDLPWGHHETSVDISALYEQVRVRLEEIGESELRCTFLAASDTHLVKGFASWLNRVHERRTVLIHGRKATLVAGKANSIREGGRRHPLAPHSTPGIAASGRGPRPETTVLG